MTTFGPQRSRKNGNNPETQSVRKKKTVIYDVTPSRISDRTRNVLTVLALALIGALIWSSIALTA
jgi:hypothetical protein